MQKRSLAAMIIFLFLLAAASPGSSESDDPVAGQLVIFHAGSLAVPFKEIAGSFMKEYPGVTVMREIDGSRTCARKITDLHKRCDVFASADYTVIDYLLIPDHAGVAGRAAPRRGTDRVDIFQGDGGEISRRAE